MLPITLKLQVEVPCPTCPESYAVQLDTIRASQRLLDLEGTCTGMASYECPATYLASLVPPDVIARLEGALAALEEEARRHGVRLRWAGEGEPARED